MTSKKYKFSLVGFWIGIGSTLCNSSHHQWAVRLFFGELSKWGGDLLMIKDQKKHGLTAATASIAQQCSCLPGSRLWVTGKHNSQCRIFTFIKVCQCFVSTNGIVYLKNEKQQLHQEARNKSSQIPEPSPKFYINALKVVVMGILFQRKSKLPNRFDIWLRKLPTVKRVASSWAESGLEGRWWSMFVIFRLIATWIFLWPLAGAKRLWELRNKGN